MTDPLGSLRPSRLAANVPWWFERLVGALASALIGYGLVGMVLALIGWFRIGPGLALGTAMSYSLFAQWFKAKPRGSGSWRVWLPAVGAVGIAIASFAFNASAAGEALLSDGETGVMTLAGRHLDLTGSLTVEASAGPFSTARVGFVSDGFIGSGVGGTLDSAVPHLMAVYRGIAGWFGLTALLAVGALLGAVALLSFYWFASRIVHPPIALLLTAALGLSLPFVHAARGAYPEIVGLAAIFSGLGLMWGLSRSLDPWRGAIAGLLFGLPILARPEWGVLVIPIGVFLVLEFVESTKQSWLASRSHRRFLASMAAGFAVPTLVAVADATRSGIDLGPRFEVRRTVIIIALAAVVFGVVRLTGQLVGVQPRFAYADIRRAVAFLLATVIVVGALAVSFRPEASSEAGSEPIAQTTVGDVLTIDPERSYAEQTGRSVAWYLGLLTVLFGVAGFVLLVFETTESVGRETFLFLLIAVAVSFAVIAAASRDPTQILASRRILIMTMPSVLIGAGVLGQRIYDAAPRYLTRSTVAVGVGFALVVGTPLWILHDVADLSDHRGARAGVEAMCELLDRRDVVLFAETAHSVPGAVLAQTVRDMCKVPAARAADPSAGEIADLATAWSREGRRLIIISEAPWQGVDEPSQIELSWRGLERTLEERPDGAALGTLTLYLGAG